MADSSGNLPSIAELTSENASLKTQLRDALIEIAKLRLLLREAIGDSPVPTRASTLIVSEPVAAHVQTQIALPAQAPTTNAAKLALFRSLFRGRDDVYAEQWQKDGRINYAPAKYHKWDTHISGENGGSKCGTNCKLLPLTDKVISEHLQGLRTLGVYPLLPDNTCWFLAIDFDKADWQTDVLSFAETCDRLSVPAHIERSRSGNGGHIWIFFNRPVTAAKARNLGAFLISETKKNRYQLAFTSYDRMFPNQDLMPAAGFGNLIALPLQKEARANGNNVFLDRTLKPYEDQWGYLAKAQKMDANELDKIVRSASERDAIFSVPLSSSDESSNEPWKHTFKKQDSSILKAPIPSTISAVKSDMIYVPKIGFSSPALNRLMSLGAFQNPEFYKKQAMRQSTHDTPRVICCSEDLEKYIAIPRGCSEELEKICGENKIDLKYIDQRTAGTDLPATFTGELREKQLEAVRALSKNELGILSASTAFGKTVVAADMIARRKVNTLILVHTVAIIDQWRSRLEQFLDIPPKSIGQIGGGKTKPTGLIDIATIQSLVRKDEVSEVVANYGQIIVDECHHLSAFSFEKVIKRARPKYVLGLTATPVRKDGHQPIIMMHCGPIRFKHSTKDHMRSTGIKYTVSAKQTGFVFAGSSTGEFKMHEVYEALAKDEARNEIIFNDILTSLSAKRSPLVLTERVEHLDGLAERLKGFAKNVIVLKGGMKKKERASVLEQLAGIPSHEERIILATSKYVGEGFDDARLDTLFLLLPISFEGHLEQYAGRLLRDQPGKTEVQIFDYMDLSHPVLAKMYEKRCVKYRQLGYEIVFGGK